MLVQKKTKREKLSEAYKFLKQGYTLRYVPELGSRALCWINEVRRPDAPDFGKKYIYWEHFGSSANKVTLRDFKFILDVIFKVKDYSAFTLEDKNA